MKRKNLLIALLVVLLLADLIFSIVGIPRFGEVNPFLNGSLLIFNNIAFTMVLVFVFQITLLIVAEAYIVDTPENNELLEICYSFIIGWKFCVVLYWIGRFLL